MPEEPRQWGKGVVGGRAGGPPRGSAAHNLMGEIKTLMRVFSVCFYNLESKLDGNSSLITVTVSSLPNKRPARRNWWVNIYGVWE